MSIVRFHGIEEVLKTILTFKFTKKVTDRLLMTRNELGNHKLYSR